MEPKISVIIPVYNVELYLRQCLDSVINQTYHNLEIIVIDDGSPDNCGKICDEYAKKDSRIVVIHKENEGVSAARNDGLEIVTGDWITFVDSDDWIEPDYCENFIQFVAKHPADMIFFGGIIYENGSNESMIRRSVHSEFVYTKRDNPEKWETLLAKVLSYKIADEHLSNQLFFGAICCAFHNARSVKNIDIRFCTNMEVYEDGMFNYMMIKASSRIGVVPYIGYHYRKTNIESVTSRYVPGRINNLSIYIHNIQSISSINKMQLLKNSISYIVLSGLLLGLKSDYFHVENPKSSKQIKQELLSLKHESYIQQAIREKHNHLLPKKMRLFKLCLRLPGVWSIKPFYTLCELLKRNETLRRAFSNK